MSHNSRRGFLKKSSLISSSLMAMSAGLVSTDVFASALHKDLPYYRAGSPFRKDLRVSGSGIPLVIKGKVYQEDGRTPLAGATVEIWHCDRRGRFDNSTPGYHYRGKTQADKNGEYKFMSHIPGKHEEDGQKKMSRVFFLVSAPGHKEQFSQLYFTSMYETHIDGDHWAQSPLRKFADLPTTKVKGGTYEATYNHYLTGNPFLDSFQSLDFVEKSVKLYPNPARGNTSLSFGGYEVGDVEITLYDETGRLVKQMAFKATESDMNIDLSDLGGGLFVVQIATSRFGRYSRTLVISE